MSENEEIVTESDDGDDDDVEVCEFEENSDDSEGRDDEEDEIQEDTNIKVNKSSPNTKKNTIISNKETYENYATKIKVSKPYIYKFEKTKILGMRASQLEHGDLPLVSVPEHIQDAKSIAELEYEEKLIPFLIRRYLPDGEHEDWRLSDFLNS